MKSELKGKLAKTRQDEAKEERGLAPLPLDAEEELLRTCIKDKAVYGILEGAFWMNYFI